MAMAEMGCQHATIAEGVLASLASLTLETAPLQGDHSTKHWGSPTERLLHLTKIDPLAGPGWDGTLASTEVDYLADNGAALDKAIEEDAVTKKAVAFALEMFQGMELQSKAAIEEILKEF
jgi:transaldolase